MKIDIKHTESSTAVVRPVGQVDVDTAQELKEKLKEVAEGGASLVVVDLGEVDFIDSSGLSALVSGLKALRQRGGALNLSRPHPQALTALRLTMLDRVFSIYPSVEEALGQKASPAS